LTRALKNARYLQSHAPDAFKRDANAQGFGTGIPLDVLRALHRLPHDSPLLHPHRELQEFVRRQRVPAPERTARGPLFNGRVHFAQVTFTTSSGNLTVPTADMNMIVQYAQHAVVPINEYARQYGQNSVSIASALVTRTINVPSGTFNDGDLDGWVNAIATAQGFGANDCVFVVFPSGLTGTGTNTSAIGANSGFHWKANVPYVAAGVFSTGLTLKDDADVYAMVVSHELAEMVIDPNVDFSNPEVCDPCDINCNNLTRVYFDASDEFLGVNQASPPGGFTFAYYICSIVKPDGGSDCPASKADCEYAPTVPNLQFIVEKSTFGVDEVELRLPGPASFAPAYWLAVDGLDASELGLNSPGDLSSNPPGTLPTVSVTVDAGVNSGLSGTQLTSIRNALPNFASYGPVPVIADDPSLGEPLQRFLYPFTVVFSDDGVFQPLNPDQSVIVTLTATLTVGSLTLSNSANFELVKGENPYFEDVDPNQPQQPFWLSFDLRFFTLRVPSGQQGSRFGATMGTDPAAAPGFIRTAIDNLTANTNLGGDSFDGLEQDEERSALEFLQQDDDGNFAFNFAIARVRLRGKTPGASAVAARVFFRLFSAQTTGSAYNESSSYRFFSDGIFNGRKVPRMGVQNDGSGTPEFVTIPCFAAARINLNAAANMDDQHDDGNVRTIVVDPTREVDAYFGCWLDVNQPQQKFLPNPVPAGNFEGPWPSRTLSLNEAITRAPHQCLIAEIKFDDTPIPGGASSSTSDKLAQRNIAWVHGPNPGEMESRRMPHPIEILPTVKGASLPDELMIVWGKTPATSSASLYLPDVSSTDILTLANRLYPEHRLSASDAHTIKCPVGGATFIPIPPASARLAGLLTVDLPLGIKKGDRYDILVRQLSAQSYTPPPPIKRGHEHQGGGDPLASAFDWRVAVGGFAFAIVISTKGKLLFREERLLAWLRWIQLSLATSNRWYPVFQRYIDQIAGRIHGFGGNPVHIPPSPVGHVPGHQLPPPKPTPEPHPGHKPPHPTHHAELEYTGKVTGILSDRFGDFEGFVLLTERGEEKHFRGREHQVHHLVQKAWQERSVISVFVTREDPAWPVSILVRRAPEPFQT
jgi:hypothetical protein